MTKVTCPKCNHTFDIDYSGYNPWSTTQTQVVSDDKRELGEEGISHKAVNSIV